MNREVEGVPVEVVRKRCRNINIRIGADGTVRLTVPVWRTPLTDVELASLKALLAELNAQWSARVGESDVAWKVRKVKSIWGCCHWRERYITYNAELARAPRELVEYVVAHEYTHFAAHGHGPKFYALMDERLPGWKRLRRRLNHRDW